MKGVLDLVNEFHTFNGGSCASGLATGCRHGGCWREDIELKEVPDNKNRCLNGGKKRKERRAGRGKSIKRETKAMEGEGLLFTTRSTQLVTKVVA